MKKAYILVAMILIAIVLFLMLIQTQQVTAPATSEQINTDTQNQMKEETLSGKDTFANLFKVNRPLECTFSYNEDGRLNEGTVFINGKKSRIESMYNDSNGVTFASSLIVNGEIMHIWGDAPQGKMAIKMKIPTSAESAGSASQSQFNLNTAVDYTCALWNVDESIFVPPSDVQFLDIDDMMQGVEGFQIPSDQVQ